MGCVRVWVLLSSVFNLLMFLAGLLVIYSLEMHWLKKFSGSWKVEDAVREITWLRGVCERGFCSVVIVVRSLE